MILAAFGVVVIAFVAAIWMGSRRQQNALAADIRHLIQSETAQGAGTQPADSELENVPAPVARYLRLVLRTPKHIQRVHIRQIGRSAPT
jgi:hypothetical protein